MFDNNNIYYHYSPLYNRISDAILIEDENRIVQYANHAFCLLFRIKVAAEKLPGLHTVNSGILASFVVKNPSKFLNRIDEIIEQNIALHNEVVVLKDGSILERDCIPTVLYNKKKGFIWLYKMQTNSSTNIPISIKEPTISNTFFEQLLHHFPIPLSIVNSNNEYIFINKEYLPNTIKREFLLGKTDAQLANYYNLPLAQANLHATQCSKALQQMQLVHFEEQEIDSNKQPQILQTFFYPFTIHNEENKFVAKYKINITSLKNQQEDLHNTLQLYKQIVNKVNNLVLVSDSELQTTFVNNTWKQQLLQTSSTDGIENIFNTISISNYSFYKQVFELLNGDVQSQQGKIQLQQNNKSRWYNYSLETTPNNKKEKKLVTILNDITNEVVLEENLYEVVKREKELNDLKSAFVNMVSHELRTPLAVIASGAEIIGLMLQAKKPTENIQPYIQQITDEVERMTAFMNDLLMVSKIEAGKVEFNTSTVNLSTFVQTIIANQFAPYKDGRHIELHTKGNLKEAEIDEKMLRHVLQNLLDNACKYSLHKPAPYIRIQFGKTYATISIVDTGIGIHTDDIPKLFTSFTRGRNVADIAGTGIGLVVVKYFIEQHKGQLFIKSKEGKGSIFTIKIPYTHG
jgi:signal transduction histidine kinase